MAKTSTTDTAGLGEFLARRWAAHKERFQAVRFEFPGGVGFGVLDRGSSPPSGQLVASWDDGKVKSLAVTPSESGAARGAAELFRDAVSGALDEREVRPLPARQAAALFGLGAPAAGAVGAAARSAALFCERLPDRAAAERIDAAALALKEERRLLDAGLDEIQERMNADALHALRAADEFGWTDYAFYALGGERGERRRQAADAYPLLATLMARRPSLKIAIDASGRRPEGAEKTVSLNDALQKAFGNDDTGAPRLGKAVLKRLNGLDWPTGGIAPDRLVLALAEIPADWFPRTREDWDAFCDLTATVGATLRDVTRLPPETLYKDCGGRWAEFALRCAKAYTDTRPPEGFDLRPPADAVGPALKALQAAIDWKAVEAAPRADVPGLAARIAAAADAPEGIRREDVEDWIRRLHAPDTGRQALRNACLDVEDMVASLAYQVVLPLAANENRERDVYISDVQIERAMDSAAEILFAAKAAPGVFELSRHWHTQQEQIRARIVGEEAPGPEVRAVEVAPDGWAPLTASAQAPNGVWMVPLTDPRMLADEGRRGVNKDGSEGLHHCVGGYHDACRDRGHHIVAVRRIGPDGRVQRLSTAEVLPVAHGQTELKVRQHRGRHNATPPADALAAWEWYLGQVRSGALAVNHDRIRVHLTQVYQKVDDVRKLSGYDWRNREAVARAMAPWAPYVGKRYRRMDADEFARQPEMDVVRQSISPTLAPVR